MTIRTDDLPLFQTRKLHANSQAAFKADKKELGGRSLEVLTEVRANGPGTDREICKRLAYPHRSWVQPRISDLIRLGHLIELESVPDSTTGKSVRKVGLA